MGPLRGWGSTLRTLPDGRRRSRANARPERASWAPRSSANPAGRGTGYSMGKCRIHRLETRVMFNPPFVVICVFTVWRGVVEPDFVHDSVIGADDDRFEPTVEHGLRGGGVIRRERERKVARFLRRADRTEWKFLSATFPFHRFYYSVCVIPQALLSPEFDTGANWSPAVDHSPRFDGARSSLS